MDHTNPLVLYTRTIPNQGTCILYRYLFTIGLLTHHSSNIMDAMYQGRYCYEHLIDAVQAINMWDGVGDPPGPWIKYKGVDGERSNPNKID